MRFGSGPLNKYEYASTIAVSLAYLLLRQQDAVGCTAFDETIRHQVPPRTKRTHLGSVIQALDVSHPRDKTDLSRVLRDVTEETPRRGMVVVISDLLVPRKGLFSGIKMLRQRGHDIMIFHVLADEEIDFPYSGPTRFEGLESTDQLNCNPRALRDGYLEALEGYLDEVRRGCAKNAVDYALIRTSDPLDAALAAYLCNRLGMHHRN